MTTPILSVEVIVIPVTDVDRALRFYVDQAGFSLDVDYSPTGAFRVVQLTPPGSKCSIQVGKGLTDTPAGSVRNIYLVVADLEAARKSLLTRGVKVSEIRHKTPVWAANPTLMQINFADLDLDDAHEVAYPMPQEAAYIDITEQLSHAKAASRYICPKTIAQ